MKSPFFKTIGITVAILFVVGIIGMATSPKCPGCGKQWDGVTSKYCFGCQAEQKRAEAGLTTHCAYPSCPNYTSGAKYCSKHTCNYSGCSEKVSDPLNGYCNKHK